MHKLILPTSRNYTLIAAAVVFCIFYIALAITPSSYALGMHLLGQPIKGLIAGTPRSIRSDEWIVFTPYVQLAVKSHFSHHDLISPYHEALKAFFSLPILDWAAVFKPYYAAFLILPPANAYSFFYLFNVLAFIFGWAWFFRLLRIKNNIAIGTAFILFFSQFIQVWWTSNSGAFALAPWAAIAWISLDRRWMRVTITSYALAVWLLADLYPPFIYSLAFALFFAVLALRPDLLTIPRIIDAALAGSIAVGVSFAYFGRMIHVMEGTVYPGHRLSQGGSVELAKLVAQFYPFALTRKFEPLSILHKTNACEIAVVGTLLPIFCLAFLDYHRLRKIAREHLRSFSILLVGIVFCAAWIFLPIPTAVGKIFGLTLVPGNRLLLALGWLMTAMSMALMSACDPKVSRARVASMMLVMAAVIYCKYLWAGGHWHSTISYFDFTPLAALSLLLFFPRKASDNWMPILVAALCTNVVTFGLFNPVQSAYPIFSTNRSAIEKHLAANGAKMTPSGALVIPGDWGALVNGVGIPSFNHVLLYPQLGIFKTYFGELQQDQFNNLFNRYEHVSFTPSGSAKLLQADLVQLPMSSILFPVEAHK